MISQKRYLAARQSAAACITKITWNVVPSGTKTEKISSQCFTKGMIMLRSPPHSISSSLDTQICRATGSCCPRYRILMWIFMCIRLKPEMWAILASEMKIPWRAAEAMHWHLGEEEIARRAGTVPFSLSSSVTLEAPPRNRRDSGAGPASSNLVSATTAVTSGGSES